MEVKGYYDFKGILVFSLNSKSYLKLLQGTKNNKISKPVEKLNKQYDLVIKNKFS